MKKKKIGKKVYEQIKSYHKFHSLINEFFEKGKIDVKSEYINKEIKLFCISSRWINSWKKNFNYEEMTTSLKDYRYEFLKNYNMLDFNNDFEKFNERDAIKRFYSKIFHKPKDFDCMVDESTYNLFKIFKEKSSSSDDAGKISCIFYENLFALLIRDYSKKSRIKIFLKDKEDVNKMNQYTIELPQKNIKEKAIDPMKEMFNLFSGKTEKLSDYCFIFKFDCLETPKKREILFKELSSIFKEDIIKSKIKIRGKICKIWNNNSFEKYYTYSENKIKNIESIIIKNANSPRTIGLQNIGATCYMNATLQCLVNIKLFTNYLLTKDNLISILTNKETCEILISYVKLLLKLCCDDKVKNYYAPYDFKNILSIKNPLFQGVQANDSKDLIYFLLEQMNYEFNTTNLKINPNLSNDENNNFNLNENDQTNKNIIFNNFIKEYSSTNNNIIPKLFFSLVENESICKGCNTHKYNYQIIFSLEMPLETLYNKIYGNQNIMNNQPKKLDINQCISNFNETNYFTGENAMYCNICQKLMNSEYNKRMYSLSPIIIIILNRGPGNKFNCDVDFNEEINFQPYLLNPDINYSYKLFGVVTHFGSSDMGGHFIAYCKHRILNEWYCYNDAAVTRLNDQENGYKKGVPYILFYESIQGDKNILYETLGNNGQVTEQNNNNLNNQNLQNINFNFNNNNNNFNINNFNNMNMFNFFNQSQNFNNNQINNNISNNNPNNINNINMNFNMNSNINNNSQNNLNINMSNNLIFNNNMNVNNSFNQIINSNINNEGNNFNQSQNSNINLSDNSQSNNNFNNH